MERLSPFLLTFLLILMLVLVSLMITGKHAVKAFVPIKLFRTINTILPKCFHEAFFVFKSGDHLGWTQKRVNVRLSMRNWALLMLVSNLRIFCITVLREYIVDQVDHWIVA